MIAAVATPQEAVQLYRERRPDMTLMDLDFPNDAGIHAIIQIRRINPNAAILGLLTDDRDDAVKNAAIRAGVRGCVAKSTVTGELISKISEHCAP